MHDDDDRDVELTREETARLAALAPGAAPPAELEERVVAALRRRGMIRSGGGGVRVAALAAGLLLALAAGYAGFWLGSRSGPPPDAGAAGGQPTFALLVFDPVTGTPAGQGGDAVAEASAWAAELARDGVLAHAEKLSAGGRRVLLRDGQVQRAPDFPPPDEELVLGGFFLIRAANYEEAQRIAAACPLLRYGSTIEIRAFEEV